MLAVALGLVLAAVGLAGDDGAELDEFELLLVRPTMPATIPTITPMPTITFQAIWKNDFIVREFEFLGPLLDG